MYYLADMQEMDFDEVHDAWVKPYDSTNAALENRGFEEAEKAGLDVVLPTAEELQIDIDNDAQYNHFHAMMPMFREIMETAGYAAVLITYKPSVTEGHFHITVRVPEYEFADFERIGWQAILGSDPKREALNAQRVIHSVDDPVAFFEKRDA